MAKENFVIALDNLLKRYNKDREWLSILCDVPFAEMNKILSDKKFTYGQLQALLARGGIQLAISIQGQPLAKDNGKRMAFLRQNVTYHCNGSNILRNATGNQKAPDIWWEKDDITMQDLSSFEKSFSVTFLYTFNGLGATADVMKNKVEKSVTNWKTVARQVVERFRANASKIWATLTEDQRKTLLTRAVRVDFNPKTDFVEQEVPAPKAASAPSVQEEEQEVVDYVPNPVTFEGPDEIEHEPHHAAPFVHSTKRTPNKADSPNPEKNTKPMEKKIEETTDTNANSKPSKVVSITFHSLEEVETITKLASEKGISRSLFIYEEIAKNVFNKPKEEKEKTADPAPVVSSNSEVNNKKSISSWLAEQPDSMKEAYSELLSEWKAPWSAEEMPYGPDTVLALRELTWSRDHGLIVLWRILQKAMSDGEVSVLTKENPSLYMRTVIEANRRYIFKQSMYLTALIYLSSCKPGAFIECSEPLHSPASPNTVINRIECRRNEETNQPFLVYYGERSGGMFKKKVKLSDNDDPELFSFIDDWGPIAVAAEEKNHEYAVVRRQAVVDQATGTMKNSLDKIEEAFSSLRQNFRVVVAELIDAKKAKDYIYEIGDKIYSEPRFEFDMEHGQNRVSIQVVDNAGERRLAEEQIPIQDLIELADSIKAYLTK